MNRAPTVAVLFRVIIAMAVSAVNAWRAIVPSSAMAVAGIDYHGFEGCIFHASNTGIAISPPRLNTTMP